MAHQKTSAEAVAKALAGSVPDQQTHDVAVSQLACCSNSTGCC